jgi:hypothetical protein
LIGIMLCAAAALAVPSAQISFPGLRRRADAARTAEPPDRAGAGERKPATFWWTLALISASSARTARNSSASARRVEKFSGAGARFGVAAIGNFSIGGASFGPTEVALVSASQFRGTAPGRGIPDGVIGLDLLKRRDAIINCRTRQLFLKTDPASRLDLQAITRRWGSPGFLST